MPRQVVLGISLVMLGSSYLVMTVGSSVARAQVAPVAPARDANLVRAQTIPVGTAVIAGVVLEADTGRPIRGARLQLGGTSTVAPAGTTTGTRGRGAAAPGASVMPPMSGPAVRSVSGAIAVSGPVSQAGGPTPTGVPTGEQGGLPLSRQAISDEQGRFTFDALPPGRFTLSASREPFLQAQFGQKAPLKAGTPLRVSEGQRISVRVPMFRGGVISGSITGEDGEPLMRVFVRAARFQYMNGIRRLSNANGVSTDDRGQYRIFGLTPGDYVVSVAPQGVDYNQRLAEQAAAAEAAFRTALEAARTRGGSVSTISVPLPPQPANGMVDELSSGSAPTYYPSVASATQASIVTVAANEERAGIDVRALGLRAFNVTGTVTGIPGSQLRVQVSIVNDESTLDPYSSATNVDANGRFVIRAVPPGQYLVIAQTQAPLPLPNAVAPAGGSPMRTLEAGERLSARASIVVDGQGPSTVALTLQPGRSISGRVEFDLVRRIDPATARVNVTLAPAPGLNIPMMGPASQAPVGADGRFVLAGVAPGRYLLRATAFATRSAIVNGEDILDFPLDVTGDRDITDVVITATDRTSQVGGVLSDAAGAETSDYSVLLFATDPRFWTPNSRRVLMTRPGTDGRFTMRGMPHGEYYLAALTDLESGAQYDPELLKAAVPASVRVTLADGQPVTQDIRLAR